MERPEATTFLNVDLDVEAPFDLSPLVEALGDRVSNMYTGPGPAGFETHLELGGELVMPSSADVAIQGFVALLHTLPVPQRKLWDQATHKEFNVGIQAGIEPRKLELAVAAATVAAVARLGARIGITVYAFDPKYVARADRRRTGR